MSYYQGPPGGYPPPQGQPQGPPYGAPPQGYSPYGAPPPPGAYGQQYPPPGQPGYPPPQPGYNQSAYPPPLPYPPPGTPYGAPPPSQYAPPPNPYGGPLPPPPGSYPPQQPYGSYQPPQQPYYDPNPDVVAIRKATKGFGTDENALINILARGKTAYQMEQLRKAFEAQVGKSLIHVIEHETSGWFEYGLRGLVLGPLGFDVWLCHRGCHGFGTHEDLLVEVLVGRTNEDIEILKGEYYKTYHKELKRVVDGETSFKTERMFDMILAANRPPENYPVDPQKVESDIRALYDAGQGRMGTDEIAFCGIIFNRSDAQLRQIAHGYKHKHHRALDHVIHEEFSGHMQHALLYIVQGALDIVGRDARLLEAAMEGAGTKDERLTYRIIRAYWKGGGHQYLQEVRRVYQEKYRHNLIKRIKGETHGDYERLLVALLEG